MSGPPPKPSALKIISGNPGKRAQRPEPDPDYLDDLTPPAHLPEHVARVWSDLAPKLRKAHLLTQLDVPALEMVCAAIANHRIATQTAGLNMMMHNAETGAFSPSPWLIIQSMAFKQAFVGLSRFGMTPADRARVIVNPQTDLFAQDEKAARYF